MPVQKRRPALRNPRSHPIDPQTLLRIERSLQATLDGGIQPLGGVLRLLDAVVQELRPAGPVAALLDWRLRVLECRLIDACDDHALVDQLPTLARELLRPELQSVLLMQAVTHEVTDVTEAQLLTAKRLSTAFGKAGLSLLTYVLTQVRTV